MSHTHHVPVLLEECLAFFEPLKIETFVDGTLGAAGHAKAILKAHPEIKHFFGMDQDMNALKIASEELQDFEGKVELIANNFCQLSLEMKSRNLGSVDGILLDIGVSSMQIDQAQRGFSFSKEGPLDMRMDQECSLTAEEIVNTWPERELIRIFEDYGDIPKAKNLAKALLDARRKKRIQSTKELTQILTPVATTKKRSLPPMTLIFQALRIAVNNELDVLNAAIPPMAQLLSVGGRLAIISFHSGEDRIVKNLFRDLALKGDESGEYEVLTKKPVSASKEEMRKNSRSKSAKLRVLKKVKSKE